MLSHPASALFTHAHPFPILAECEHYAGTEKFIDKSFTLQQEIGPVFDITCDLEDGARQGSEQEHATLVANLIASSANRFKKCGVRIHDYQSPFWKSDLKTLVSVAGNVLSYVTIPKVSSLASLKEMLSFLDSCLVQAKLNITIPIHVLIETHQALADVWHIAALPQVQVLDFGLWDFIAEHHGAIPEHCMRSPGQFEHHLLVRAKTEIVAAALANGVVPAHNVTLAISDSQQVHSDAKRAKDEFGFLRMWSIHPDQIRPIVEAMKPDFSQIEKACAILLAAQKANWGPIRHDHQLHDRATYRYFWELLERSRLYNMPLPPEAEAAFFPK